MPFIRITHSGPALPGDTIRLLQQETTRQMADILHKDEGLTAVLVEEVSGHWSIAGKSRPRGRHTEAIITKGTNSEAEKAAFLAANRALTAKLFPDLAGATYAVIAEVEAPDWGYDGLSQAERRRRREAI